MPEKAQINDNIIEGAAGPAPVLGANFRPSQSVQPYIPGKTIIPHSSEMEISNSQTQLHEALDKALDLLARKWMLEIIQTLLNGRMRFLELRTTTGCRSPSTFTRRLRLLEREGIVSRIVHPLSPRHIEYELTEKGLSLGRVLSELSTWGEKWLSSHSQITEIQNRK